MKIALIADLHANAVAFNSVLDVIDSCDRVVCLGDVVGYYTQVNETIDLLRKYNPLCIMGNHDYFVLNGCPKELQDSVQFGIDYARRTITAQNRQWLASLPQVWGGEVEGISCLFFHGSPWKPMEDYLYSNSQLLEGLDAFKYDLLAFGQTHRPLFRVDIKPYLINPGSIGQSREASLYGKACMAVLDTETKKIQAIVRDYDMPHVINEALSHGAGPWVQKFTPQAAI
ncbi:MAG TPA: metallophosphoesterase family protein [Planktothrix sp.]